MATEKSGLEDLQALPPKPLSSHAKGARLGNTKRNLLRDNFEISTWLAMGAGLQCLLFAAPISSVFAVGPALALLAFKLLRTVLVWRGILPNLRMASIHAGGNFYAIPEGASTGNGGRAEFAALPGSEEICVGMITGQSHQ